MALILCDECGTQVSDKALACTKCGNPIASLVGTSPVNTAPAEVKKTKKSSAMAIGGLIVLAVIVYIFYDMGKPAKNTSVANTEASQPAAAPADAAPAEVVLQVSAKQLAQDYNANEVAADAKYKDKLLEVTGTLEGINKDFSDDPYLTLETDNQFLPVHANYSKADLADLSKLVKGQDVTMTCRGKGMMVGSPILDCTQS